MSSRLRKKDLRKKKKYWQSGSEQNSWNKTPTDHRDEGRVPRAIALSQVWRYLQERGQEYVLEVYGTMRHPYRVVLLVN